MQVRRRESHESKASAGLLARVIAWASALFLLLAFATTFVMRYFQPSSQPPRKIMFTVEPPPGYKPIPDGAMALSPDGAQIAYAVTDAKGKKSLWVRALDSLSPRLLEGSETIDGLSTRSRGHPMAKP